MKCRPSQNLLVLGLALVFFAAMLPASAQTNLSSARLSSSHDLICQMIQAVAQKNDLPVDFLTRVIWQESHFKTDVIGPPTASGEHAEGIAQFMPGTAAARGLLEPFNPLEALPKSGEFLAELRRKFGNLGLAAAAYNAGQQRVHDFLAGGPELPPETRNYVMTVTGRPIEDWVTRVKIDGSPRDNVKLQTNRASTACHDVVTLLEQTANPLPARWRNKIFPSWCKGLEHPDVSICGPVHLIGPSQGMSQVSTARTRVHVLSSITH
jgi:Transglycosylase SLT domain